MRSGVLPNNPNLSVNDLTDVRQLDALVRSHVLLAELTGRDGACYADILLQAYGYLVRLWKVSQPGAQRPLVDCFMGGVTVQWGGSICRVSDSRSKDPRIEPCQERMKNLWGVLPQSQNCCADNGWG